MEETYQLDSLQPSLLDRLVDTTAVKGKVRKKGKKKAVVDSEVPIESKAQLPPKNLSDNLFITSEKLRECVKRDLSWLLNTGSLDTVVDFESYPHASKSVLNYGIPDLTGVAVANADETALQKILQRVILEYEPRIIKNTLRVAINKSDEMSRNALRFEIECDIWGQPAPEHLLLNSEIDLETGSFNFVDSSHG